MKRTRRSFLSVAAILAGAFAAEARAQYGGRSRDRGDGASNAPPRPGDAAPRGPSALVVDPAAAVERELPSLRIDLKLNAEQGPLFDSFERQVRNAAEAGRMRARHLGSFRTGDAGTMTAETVLGTIADDDVQRAEAIRLAVERMTALYAALTPDQRKQFDRRILQSLREPLGNS
jgi:hypothetical protein